MIFRRHKRLKEVVEATVAELRLSCIGSNPSKRCVEENIRFLEAAIHK